MALFLRFASLVLVAVLLLVFQGPNCGHAVQKEDIDDDGISVTGVGKLMGGTKMAKEWNAESTGNDEISFNGFAEGSSDINEEDEEDGSPSMFNHRDEEGRQVRLLEEVMQLMRRDYRGMSRPRRTPPIPD